MHDGLNTSLVLAIDLLITVFVFMFFIFQFGFHKL